MEQVHSGIYELDQMFWLYTPWEETLQQEYNHWLFSEPRSTSIDMMSTGWDYTFDQGIYVNINNDQTNLLKKVISHLNMKNAAWCIQDSIQSLSKHETNNPAELK